MHRGGSPKKKFPTTQNLQKAFSGYIDVSQELDQGLASKEVLSKNDESDGYVITSPDLPMARVMPVIKTTQEIFDKSHIKYVSMVASGLSGAIMICEYDGHDEAIKSLLVENKFIVKIATDQLQGCEIDTTNKSLMTKLIHANLTYLNEWETIYVMNRKSKANAENGLPLAAALLLEGVKIVCYQPIYFDRRLKTIKHAQSYFSELGANHFLLGASALSSETIQRTQDCFNNIFISTLLSLKQFHQRGFLHLDFAARNVAIADKGASGLLIDWGLSQAVGKNGRSHSHLDFSHKPVYVYDQEAIRNIIENTKKTPTKDLSSGANIVAGVYSIKTDLFSFKIFIIECIAYYFGVNSSVMYSKIHPGEDASSLVKLTDIERLTGMYNNLEKIIKSSSALKGHQAELALMLLEKYKNFILTDISQLAPHLAWEHYQQRFDKCADATPRPSKTSRSLFQFLQPLAPSDHNAPAPAPRPRPTKKPQGSNEE